MTILRNPLVYLKNVSSNQLKMGEADISRPITKYSFQTVDKAPFSGIFELVVSLFDVVSHGDVEGDGG